MVELDLVLCKGNMITGKMVKTNCSELWKLIKGQQQSENRYSKSTCPSPTSNSRLSMYQTLFKGPSQKT